MIKRKKCLVNEKYPGKGKFHRLGLNKWGSLPPSIIHILCGWRQRRQDYAEMRQLRSRHRIHAPFGTQPPGGRLRLLQGQGLAQSPGHPQLTTGKNILCLKEY